jgi:hypothetical protein
MAQQHSGTRWKISGADKYFAAFIIMYNVQYRYINRTKPLQNQVGTVF